MWERCAEIVTAAGSELIYDTKVVRVAHRDGAAYEVTAVRDGVESVYPCDAVISSMPFRSLIRAMDPPVPDQEISSM